MCLGHLLRHREPEELSSFIEHLTTECMSFTQHSESLVLKPSSFYSQLVKINCQGLYSHFCHHLCLSLIEALPCKTEGFDGKRVIKTTSASMHTETH